jgi:hypothetical protein
MTQRRKIILGSLVGAAAIHLVFLACGTPSDQRDAQSGFDVVAATMGDVAQRESSTADAQGMPPTVLEAPCVAVDGGVATAAIFDVPSVRANAVPRLRASTCGHATGFTLLPGVDPADSCLYSPPVYFSNGRVVVQCIGTRIARLVVE